MDDLIKQAEKLAFDEQARTSMPVKNHLLLSREVGLNVAQELGADSNVVNVGLLMMDAMIGQAIQENRLADHIQMSLDATNKLLETSSIPEESKENIRHCVLEHHGTEKFFSLESEICANADCYRFASVKGFLFAIRGLRDMEFEDLMKLVETKVEEKWAILTLDICKKELTPQHETIRKLLDVYNNTNSI